MILSVTIPFNAQAKTEEEVVQTEKLDLSSVTNLNEVLTNLDLSKDEVLEKSFRIPSDNTAIVNVKDNESDTYYNLFVEGNEITSYSKQKELENSNSEFELYDLNGTALYNSVVDKNGQEVSESTPAADDGVVKEASGPSRAAIAWACLFASKMSCVAAAGAAAGVGMISGPWGAAITGSAAGSACEMLFTTLVEEYGNKAKACSVEAGM